MTPYGLDTAGGAPELAGAALGVDSAVLLSHHASAQQAVSQTWKPRLVSLLSKRECMTAHESRAAELFVAFPGSESCAREIQYVLMLLPFT
jgi:hypothetical protein